MERATRRIESLVSFRNSQGTPVRGTLLHVTRNVVVFEVYNPYSIVQLSEVLSDFQIMRGERIVYSGRTVVSNLVPTGLMLIVSATLVDPWKDLVGVPAGDALRTEVQGFVNDFESSHKLVPDYQLSVSTIGVFLAELSRWLGQYEVEATASAGSDDRPVVNTLRDALTPKINELFGRFEEVAGTVPPEEEVAHKNFARRELHPLMLVSPFVHRTFTKPLGYAGDYEMVNMILRDPVEGPNTYARIVNTFVLSREPAEAHRNRIDFLVDLLTEVARKARREGRVARVLNVACGPAKETERFIRESELSNYCHFTLLDFNDETLAYTIGKLKSACEDAGRRPVREFVHKSIHDMLRESRDDGRPAQTWDLVVCAGLFDYLNDKVCSRLLKLFHQWTAADGQVAVTNVHSRNPIRLFMEHLLEWHLIYRDEKGFASLVPAEWNPEISIDSTGVNVYMVVQRNGARDGG